MTRLTLPHNDTPPAAAQEIITRYYDISNAAAPIIDHSSIDPDGFKQLAEWVDAQNTKLNDEALSNLQRLQLAQNLQAAAQTLKAIYACPDIKIFEEISRAKQYFKDGSAAAAELNAPLSDNLKRKALRLADIVADVLQQDSQAKDLRDATNKPAHHSATIICDICSTLERTPPENMYNRALRAVGKDPRIIELKNLSTDLISALKGYKDRSSWFVKFERDQQEFNALESSPDFIAVANWRKLLSTLVHPEDSKRWSYFNQYPYTSKEYYADKTCQLATAIIKCHGDLLLALYVTGTEGGYDRDGHYSGTRAIYATKIAERELARMTEAAAQTPQAQAALPILTPLRPGAVAVTSSAATKPNLAPHL